MVNLTKSELIVLNSLSKDFADLAELSKKTRLNEDTLRRAIELLKADGLVEEKLLTEKRFKLGEFGKKYLKEEFPEEILAKALDKSKPLSQLQEELGNNASLFIGLAKKENLIDIKDGVVRLLKEIDLKKLQRLHNALKELNEGIIPTDIEVLKKMQKMVEEYEKKISLIKIKSNAEKIKNTKVVETISDLSQDVLKNKSWKGKELRRYNVEADVEPIYAGKYQPYKRFLDLIRKKLTSIGFEEIDSTLVTTEFYNFDALYQPQNHPARTWTATYSLKVPTTGKLPDKKIVDNVKASHENGADTGSTGWRYKWNPEIAQKLMPSAQGTAASARKMIEGVKVPGRYFALARVYRPDVLDATHLNEFNQLEGFVVADDIKFQHLLGLLAQFAREVAGAEEIMFYPDYYPFTEPSVQLSAKHPKLGWVELGGAGIFRPELTEPLGIKQRVIAWGLGIDRLAMFNLGIKDIRDLFSIKIDWLREKPLVERI